MGFMMFAYVFLCGLSYRDPMCVLLCPMVSDRFAYDLLMLLDGCPMVVLLVCYACPVSVLWCPVVDLLFV